uniref:F-box domain-containing protein n=1 Tax=Melanopsichium pennsylvanicum 4 TaxID=1398559 RepID=A0A077RDS4_9BASI|nr:conserved hypothetical protein [Melanopsichium pennsylvanicum 4]
MSANPLNLPLPVVVDNLLPLLSNRDLAALRSVSKQAKILVEDQILWKRKVLADFTFPPHATARMGGWFELYRGLSNPQVYVWGQVSNGRLGLDPKNIHKACGADVVRTHGGMPYPVKLETINRSSSHGITLQTSPKEESTGAVVEMIAGGWSFHARTSLGKVWYWGTLDGSTFVGDLCPLRDPRKPIASPTLLHGIPDVESLSGGRLHAVALTKDHSLLEWRAWGSIWKLEGFPSSIIDPPSSSSKLEYYRHQDQDASTPMKSNIKQLEAGWTFSAILTHTGEIWIWYSEWCADAFERSYYSGYPREAMMYANPPGYGDQIVFPLTVTPVKLPPVYSGEQQEHADRVVQIAAGEDFIITLTQAGKMHKMDLHLPPPNQDDNRELYRARETMTDADDQDVEALFHRIRINLFVQNRASMVQALIGLGWRAKRKVKLGAWVRFLTSRRILGSL